LEHPVTCTAEFMECWTDLYQKTRQP